MKRGRLFLFTFILYSILGVAYARGGALGPAQVAQGNDENRVYPRRARSVAVANAKKIAEDACDGGTYVTTLRPGNESVECNAGDCYAPVGYRCVDLKQDVSVDFFKNKPMTITRGAKKDSSLVSRIFDEAKKKAEDAATQVCNKRSLHFFQVGSAHEDCTRKGEENKCFATISYGCSKAPIDQRVETIDAPPEGGTPIILPASALNQCEVNPHG